MDSVERQLENIVCRLEHVADLLTGGPATSPATIEVLSDEKKIVKHAVLRQGPQPYKPPVTPKPVKLQTGRSASPAGRSVSPNPQAKSKLVGHPVAVVYPTQAQKAESIKPVSVATVKAKSARCELEGKKWIVEYQENAENLVISETQMNQSIYIFNCQNSIIHVKGKINSITIDSCKKASVVIDDVVAAVDLVNNQSLQLQVIGRVPMLSIDKTDGCTVYLSKESINAEIVTAKSSSMNILIPDLENDGEYKEFAIPEQFKTKWTATKLVTTVNDINL